VSRARTAATAVFAAAWLSGCAELPPVKTASHVDIDRFMGDWYVIANIPTPLEKGAHNAVEQYRRMDDGRIATTFSYRDGGFDGPARTLNATAVVRDPQTGAVWGMQFMWPLEADYRVLHVAADYSATVIGREKRDYVWIMARTPRISADAFAALRMVVAAAGYDAARLEPVPQSWPTTPDAAGS